MKVAILFSVRLYFCLSTAFNVLVCFVYVFLSNKQAHSDGIQSFDLAHLTAGNPSLWHSGSQKHIFTWLCANVFMWQSHYRHCTDWSLRLRSHFIGQKQSNNNNRKLILVNKSTMPMSYSEIYHGIKLFKTWFQRYHGVHLNDFLTFNLIFCRLRKQINMHARKKFRLRKSIKLNKVSITLENDYHITDEQLYDIWNHSPGITCCRAEFRKLAKCGE